MKWTQELPSEPGFYWLMHEDAPGLVYKTRVVEIWGKPGDLCMDAAGSDMSFNLRRDGKYIDDWWWYGPLEKPEFVEAE